MNGTMNDAIWILIANSAGAKLFATNKLFGSWTLVKQFDNPEAHERDVDMISDRSGNYRNPYMKGGSSYNERTDHKAGEIDTFARTLARELDLGRSRNSFDKLIIVAPSRFQGLLKEHSEENTRHLVFKQIDKDYVNLNDQELREMVQKHLQE